MARSSVPASRTRWSIRTTDDRRFAGPSARSASPSAAPPRVPPCTQSVAAPGRHELRLFRRPARPARPARASPGPARPPHVLRGRADRKSPAHDDGFSTRRCDGHLHPLGDRFAFAWAGRPRSDLGERVGRPTPPNRTSLSHKNGLPDDHAGDICGATFEGSQDAHAERLDAPVPFECSGSPNASTTRTSAESRDFQEPLVAQHFLRRRFCRITSSVTSSHAARQASPHGSTSPERPSLRRGVGDAGFKVHPVRTSFRLHPARVHRAWLLGTGVKVAGTQ